MCERFRIPHSHYLGGPLEWTPVDRAKAEAYREWAARFCSRCGTLPAWFDPAQGGHRHALIADTWRCPGCELTEQLRDQIPQQERGVHVHLLPNPELVKQYADDQEEGGDRG